MEIQPLLAQMVNHLTDGFMADLEEMCQVALTDPEGRGIRLDTWPGGYRMELWRSVPYGTIEEVRHPRAPLPGVGQ